MKWHCKKWHVRKCPCFSKMQTKVWVDDVIQCPRFDLNFFSRMSPFSSGGWAHFRPKSLLKTRKVRQKLQKKKNCLKVSPTEAGGSGRVKWQKEQRLKKVILVFVATFPSTELKTEAKEAPQPSRGSGSLRDTDTQKSGLRVQQSKNTAKPETGQPSQRLNQFEPWLD